MELLLKYFPDLTPLQREQFAALQGLYELWNGQINVISRRDMPNLYERHILHSLAIAKCGLIRDGQSVADIGCGGGFPSIPLAILMPSVQFTAVDSVGKKIKVVGEISREIGLQNLVVRHCRAEALEVRYDWVVSRAVAQLSDFLGFVSGKYRCGILYLKGGDLAAEIEAAGGVSKVYEIKEWFSEEFFDTKRILFLDNSVSGSLQ